MTVHTLTLPRRGSLIEAKDPVTHRAVSKEDISSDPYAHCIAVSQPFRW